MAAHDIKIYWSSATGDLAAKKNQMACKDLFEKKGAKFEMIDLTQMEKEGPDGRDELFIKSGGNRTIPLVFIDGEYKGTYDDMQELEEVDELKNLIL